MNIGERLRNIRNGKGYSIYFLSKQTGISQNHISGIERGLRQPTIDTLERLTEPLGITLAELFNESDDISILSEKERLLIENFRTLPDEKADALFDLCKLLKQ